MSVETPPIPETRRRFGSDATEDGYVAGGIEAWLAAPSERCPPDQPESRDEQPRRRDVLNPAATRIGYPEDPADDIAERLRALHAGRRAETRGESERRRRLDATRTAQALCNALDLTAWERDRVLGVVCELDPDAYRSERSVRSVALAVARLVVDAERRAWLGLDDPGWLAGKPPERLDELADRLHRLADGEAYERLREECDLPPDGIDRLADGIERELDDGTLDTAALGRSPHRDPYLPAFEHRGATAGKPGPAAAGEPAPGAAADERN